MHHRRQQGTTAAAVLGDNPHRYERRHGSANDNDDDGDDNDDTGGWMMTFEGRDDAVYRDGVFGDAANKSKMTTLDGGNATEERNRASSSSMNDSQDGVAEDRIFDARR